MRREAPACRAALDEATRIWPNRSRKSDGILGDWLHRLRRSAHNPDASGYAHAFDLTADEVCPAHALVRQLAQRRDPRVKNIISQGHIWTPRNGWQKYHGVNPHDKHAHVEIYPSAKFDTRPWWITTPEEAMATGRYVDFVMPKGATANDKGRFPFYAVTAKGEVDNHNVPDGYGIKGLPERGITAVIFGVTVNPHKAFNIILFAEDGATYDIGPHD